MFMIKPIWDALFDQFNAKDDDRKKQIMRECRKAYYELCGVTSWENMRSQVVYAYDESADGMWLPADLIGIDGVTDGESVWNKSNPPGAANKSSQAKLWFVSERCKTPVVSGSTLEIQDGATAFTGATGITAAHIGEYIRIGDQSAVYKLASATTLETPYHGDVQTAAYFEVRPVGTQKIKLLSEEAEIDRTAATIYYWRFPEQLYSETQLMQLPTARVLELATAIRVNGIDRDTDAKDDAQKDLYGSKGRYEGELSRALSMNPEFVLQIIPKNKNGISAGWGAR